jgi:predicted phosphoribosyltransferase
VTGPHFVDRRDAGAQLGRLVAGRALARPVVLGLPRGGVIVAAGVADALGAPLGVVVPRKIGAPGRPELATGAVATWGNDEAVVDVPVVRERRGVDDAQFAAAAAARLAEAHARATTYPPPPNVDGSDVVVVDDGLATGATMRAALAVLRRTGAVHLFAAVPVGPAEQLAQLAAEFAVEVLAVAAPEHFGSVGEHYRDFAQVDDAEVLAELAARRAPEPPPD